MQQTLLECQKEQSILYRVLLNGPQDAYYNLKFPLSSIGLLRPLIAVLYFIVAARVFMVAIDRGRWVVFTVVLFAALFAIGAHLVTLGASREWAEKNSGCEVNLDQRRFETVAEPFLQKFAADVDKAAKDDDLWDVSVRAEGRTLLYEFRFKKPINMEAFPVFLSRDQKRALQMHCSDAGQLLRRARATETHTYYDFKGERITSFSIGPTDCPQW
jgi:hypothetical protein